MRHSIAAITIVLLSSSGTAMAAECNKGLLWPFVRDAGDCLTETEIKSGKTGVYDGPATGPVDVSTIKAPAQPASGDAAAQCHTSGIWPFRSTECSAPTPAASPGAAAASAPPPQPPAMPAAQPAKPVAAAPTAPAAKPVVAQTAAAPAESCGKGLFWPFVRESGDCGTAAQTGNGAASAVPVKASEPAVTPTATATTAAAQAPASSSTPAAAGAGGCQKGMLWPFIREAGDCPTDAERGHR